MSGVTARVRQIVLERDAYRCVRCGSYVDPFGEFSVHHRRPRGMGGSKRDDTNASANLLTLCGSGTTGCHGHIESHREEAIDSGFLLHQTDAPADHSVQTWRGPYFFDNEGCSVSVDDALGSGPA